MCCPVNFKENFYCLSVCLSICLSTLAISSPSFNFLRNESSNMAAFIKKVGSLQAHFDITRIDKNNLLSCCCILDFGSPKQINGQQRKPRNRLMEDHSNFNPVNVKHTGALCLSVSIFFLQKWSSPLKPQVLFFSSSLI